jgi:hypothetical protein
LLASFAPLIDELAMGARLMAGLPGFLRQPIRPEGARRVVEARRARRPERFLSLSRQAVWERPGGPYAHLFRQAGCEYGDLERLVAQDGVEAALERLYRAGVYLSVDELKGRRPAVRGSTSIEVGLQQLRHRQGHGLVRLRSSGSRGPSTEAVVDLADWRAQTFNLCLALAARGGRDWRLATWGVPGSVAIARILQFGLLSPNLPHFFSQVDPSMAGLHLRYRWSLRAVRLGFLLSTGRTPPIENAPLDAPLPLANWAAAQLRQGWVPLIWTHVSPALRLIRAAQDAGLDLAGLRLSVGGEPCTPTRLETLRRAGADVAPHMATMEAGTVGYGCLRPEVSDDLHLFDDLFAMILAGEDDERAGLAPGTMLLTTVNPDARFFLLNASLGDRAEVVERECGCALADQGWRQHIRNVRSFEKVTAGGMTFHDRQIVRVLEEVLPPAFGGGPLDYQLVEEQASSGEPRLRLLVHPRLGPLDEAAVLEAFLDAIGAGSGVGLVMMTQWRQAGWVRVEREGPFSTEAGKVLHLHRRTASALDTQPVAG